MVTRSRILLKQTADGRQQAADSLAATQRGAEEEAVGS